MNEANRGSFPSKGNCKSQGSAAGTYLLENLKADERGGLAEGNYGARWDLRGGEGPGHLGYPALKVLLPCSGREHKNFLLGIL